MHCTQSAININTISQNISEEDSIKQHLVVKNDIYRMKTFEFCICALACISLTSSMTILESTLPIVKYKSVRFIRSCAVEVGLDFEDGYHLENITSGNIDKPEWEERTLKHGCVIECVLRKMNWMQGLELKEEKFYTDINIILENHPLKNQFEENIRNCVTKVKLVPQESCKRGVVAMKCGAKDVYRLFSSQLNEDGGIEEDENN